VQRVDELLRDAAMFHGMAPERLELIAGCASNRIFRPGDYLLREGDRADTFFVIRRGDVAVETYVPQRGALTLETLHDGDVLGWSWLFPPYRVAFDARAAETVHTVAFDGRCLRGKCEEDHDLGYELIKRFAEVIVERLRATRMQLMDVYGHVAG
jgi:CRP/FNR family transcriptional regulator, cyclic AMP receptor protein